MNPTEDEIYELAEACELELKFDGVDDAFEQSFEDVQGSSFEAKQSEVHDDDDDVDEDELLHRFLCIRLQRCA